MSRFARLRCNSCVENLDLITSILPNSAPSRFGSYISRKPGIFLNNPGLNFHALSQFAERPVAPLSPLHEHAQEQAGSYAVLALVWCRTTDRQFRTRV